MSVLDRIKSVLSTEDLEDDYESERQDSMSSLKKKEQVSPTSHISPYQSSYGRTKTTVSKDTETNQSQRPDFKVLSDTGYGVNIVSPKDISEAPMLVEKLKKRQPVIINIESLATEKARKIFDFLSGATYALNGTVKKITNDIYMFSPNNIKIYMNEGEITKSVLE